MVSETEEVCALNVTRVFMVSSTERWDGSWTLLTCVTAQVPANNTWQTRRCSECTDWCIRAPPARINQCVRSNSFVWLGGQSVTQQMAKQWISSSTKNPMVLLDLSSSASPYQPAGKSGATKILPSWPFCARQRASIVQMILFKLCYNIPTSADYHQANKSFKQERS